MVEDAHDAARAFRNLLLPLDRYFLSVPALARLADLNASGPVRVEMITKAKQNCVAFKLPERKSGRGRPAKKGDKLVLKDLFSADSVPFTKTASCMENKRK